MQKTVQVRLTPQQAFNEENIRKALRLNSSDNLEIVRKSTDARREKIFIDLTCVINPEQPLFKTTKFKDADNNAENTIIVGSGPGGLFAAIKLMEHGMPCTIIERGKTVNERTADIAAISRENKVNSNSNYSFGEGGAGTFSDGKLYTRSKKRGENNDILNLFVQFGADKNILYEAHPHIGTNRLPKIVSNIRTTLEQHGAKFLFNTLMTDLIICGNEVKGVKIRNSETGKEEELYGKVILACGNASRDTFEMLERNKVAMRAKDLAVGVRLEHPQNLIDIIQYHNPQGRGQWLPAAEYSFSAQVNGLGVYSFCMCPGGFVVPAASANNEVVVNGMSPSNRGSKWANSGMVVEYKTERLKDKDSLAMVRIQQELEEKTFEFANKSQRAPAQRMTDFIQNKTSSSVAPSSYSPGLTGCNLNELLPSFITDALREGFMFFSSKAKGFLTQEATVIATETRTSSPVRIERDNITLESISHKNLFPCGEGAGFAGGIMSAAIDGVRCAQSVLYLSKVPKPDLK